MLWWFAASAVAQDSIGVARGDSVGEVLQASPEAALEPADTTVAQKRQLSKIRRTIRGFDRLNKSWIEPQHYIFTAMMQATHTYDLYTLSGTGDDAQSMTFAPDFKLKVGPY